MDPYRYLLWVLQNAPQLSETDEAWAEKLLPAKAPEECYMPHKYPVPALYVGTPALCHVGVFWWRLRGGGRHLQAPNTFCAISGSERAELVPAIF